MLFTVKLRYFVHKGLQLQLNLQLHGLPGAFMDLGPVPD